MQRPCGGSRVKDTRDIHGFGLQTSAHPLFGDTSLLPLRTVLLGKFSLAGKTDWGTCLPSSEVTWVLGAFLGQAPSSGYTSSVTSRGGLVIWAQPMGHSGSLK